MGRPKGSKNHTADGEQLRNSVSGAKLHAYIERVENMNQQIADAQGDRRELYAEIKRDGYDVATVRAIVKERAMDADKRHAQKMLLIEYTAALGDFAFTELGQAGMGELRNLAGKLREDGGSIEVIRR